VIGMITKSPIVWTLYAYFAVTHRIKASCSLTEMITKSPIVWALYAYFAVTHRIKASCSLIGMIAGSPIVVSYFDVADDIIQPTSL